MNKIGIFLFIALFLTSCAIKESNEMILRNPYANDLHNKEIVIPISKIHLKANLLPYLADENDSLVACQLDDMNKDGKWDELAFISDLKAHQEKIIKIKWTDSAHYPKFPYRTNIRYGKLNRFGKIEELKEDTHSKYNLPRGGNPNHPYPYQMDGPAWENDKVAFRHYFDGRNSRDVSGKIVSDMVLDTVGISSQGLPAFTYNKLQKWGCDILSVGASTGLGGLAIQMPDTLLRLGVNGNTREDIIDSTQYSCIAEGPIRSVFRLNYYGWQVGKSKIDLQETVSIWTGTYAYEETISTTKLPRHAHIITGIVNIDNRQPQRSRDYNEKYLSFSTHDKQTSNREWYLGMSIILPARNFVTSFNAPQKNSDIRDSWCIVMKPDKHKEYQFSAYAAWELSNKSFANRNYFMEMIDKIASEKSQAIKVKIGHNK